MTENTPQSIDLLQVKYMKQGELAKLLGVSARTVRQYRADGIIPDSAFNDSGAANPSIALPAVFNHLRDLHQQKVAQAPDGREALDPVYEKANLAKKQAEKVSEEIKLKQVAVAQAEGKVVDRESVTMALSAIIGSAKSRLIALPAALGAKLSNLTNRDMQLIDDVVHDTLTQLEADLPRSIESIVEEAAK